MPALPPKKKVKKQPVNKFIVIKPGQYKARQVRQVPRPKRKK